MYTVYQQWYTIFTVNVYLYNCKVSQSVINDQGHWPAVKFVAGPEPYEPEQKTFTIVSAIRRDRDSDQPSVSKPIDDR